MYSLSFNINCTALPKMHASIVKFFKALVSILSADSAVGPSDPCAWHLLVSRKSIYDGCGWGFSVLSKMYWHAKGLRGTMILRFAYLKRRMYAEEHDNQRFVAASFRWGKKWPRKARVCKIVSCIDELSSPKNTSCRHFSVDMLPVQDRTGTVIISIRFRCVRYKYWREKLQIRVQDLDTWRYLLATCIRHSHAYIYMSTPYFCTGAFFYLFAISFVVLEFPPVSSEQRKP